MDGLSFMGPTQSSFFYEKRVKKWEVHILIHWPEKKILEWVALFVTNPSIVHCTPIENQQMLDPHLALFKGWTVLDVELFQFNYVL